MPATQTPRAGCIMTVRKWNRRKWRWWMCSPLALPPWCFKSGCLGSMLWRPGFPEGLGKQGSRCCLKRLTPVLPLGSPPPRPSPDRMWCWAFQVWFLGKGPGWEGISTGKTTGMVPGISYTPVCKCTMWEAFLSSLQNPRGTERVTGPSQRGAVQGDRSSRAMPHLFHLCLHLTAVGTFWRSNYTGTHSGWAFLVSSCSPTSHSQRGKVLVH